MSEPRLLPPDAPRPRRPRFFVWIATGAIFGFAIGGFIAWSGILEQPSTIVSTGSGEPIYAPSTGVGFLGLIGAGLFGILAAALAVLADRSGRGRDDEAGRPPEPD